MSYEIGIKTIHLLPTERLAHTEYCSNAALVRAVTRGTKHSFEECWDYDLAWITHDGPVNWSQRGRVTDIGPAEFMAQPSPPRPPRPCPFTDVEQVLQFDAVKEYGLPDMAQLISFYESFYQTGQRARNLVYPGGYYKTIVSGAIQAFGWDMMLLAAADQERFGKVLDSFFRLSLQHYRAWSKTSIEVFISHDDMVWTMGPFINPDFYRRVIFPRYQELWAVLRNAGKKVLFCSDGNWTMFIDDIAAAGADGFIFEPMTDLRMVVRKYGRDKVIVGSQVDCRTLTFGQPAEIRAEVDATLALAQDCPGFVAAVGNHIPSNVPVANAIYYMDYLRQHWRRSALAVANG